MTRGFLLAKIMIAATPIANGDSHPGGARRSAGAKMDGYRRTPETGFPILWNVT
jgi:hypothetical protein